VSRQRRRGAARVAAAGAVVATAAALIAGCGIGPGGTPGQVQLTISRDFGSHPVTELPMPKLSGSDTVMRLLQRNGTVQTRYGGGFVQSIDGYAGDSAGGRQIAWFYYVNGIEAPKGAAATTVNAGDHVWWDRHDWGAAMDIRAVVGSFPEPFLHGSGGRRLPVVVECSDPSAPACAMVSHALSSIGIPAARGKLLLAAGSQELRVLVGDWPALRHDAAAAQIERGPQLSGVFARIDPAGHTLTVLDQRGAAIRTLGAGSGLIAATQFRSDEPVWVVTGTDSAGVAAAARAFEPGALHDRFALAISNDIGIALPQVNG
jgi:hypothetical protein